MELAGKLVTTNLRDTGTKNLPAHALAPGATLRSTDRRYLCPQR